MAESEAGEIEQDRRLTAAGLFRGAFLATFLTVCLIGGSISTFAQLRNRTPFGYVIQMLLLISVEAAIVGFVLALLITVIVTLVIFLRSGGKSRQKAASDSRLPAHLQESPDLAFHNLSLNSDTDGNKGVKTNGHLLKVNSGGSVTIPKEVLGVLEEDTLFEAVRRVDGVIELRPRAAGDP